MSRLRKNISTSGGTLFMLLVVLSLFLLKSLLGGGENQSPPVKDPRFIEVAGNVPTPGVFRFAAPVTLREVMKQVGLKEVSGILSGSDWKAILTSGTRVYLRDTPQGYTATLEQMSAFHKMTLGIPLDLNGTSTVGFTAISGIGPGLAALIVREREKRGFFRNIDELLQIKGISKKLLAKVRPFIKI